MMDYKYIAARGKLSTAWFKAFKHINNNGATSPLIVRVGDIPANIEELEDKAVRETLDDFLKRKGHSSVRTVANTIFPWSMWNPEKDREELYKRHFAITPSIRTCTGNYDGHYFRRMIGFDTTYDCTKYSNQKINQLDHIINTWRSGNHRHSALQIGIFDPDRDHSNKRQKGFPCLHQISLDPYGTNGKDGLGITAFYATQLNIRKAYGNYLGLCRLGYFMAHELDLKFVEMNCVVSKASIDSNAFKRKDRDELFKNINALNIYNLHNI